MVRMRLRMYDYGIEMSKFSLAIRVFVNGNRGLIRDKGGRMNNGDHHFIFFS